MPAYLVTFDSATADYARFKAFAEGFDHVRFGEGAYAIHTEQGEKAVYAGISEFTGPDDTSYVVALSKPWVGCGYTAVNEWLQRTLG